MSDQHQTTKNNFRGDRFRASKLKQYCFRLITFAISWPFTFLPESKVKHSFRIFILNIQNSVTTRLFVNKGDTVVQIGTPWPQTMHRYRKAVGAKGRLVIFEAMQHNYNLLEKAKNEAGYTNVTIFLGAAWSERKKGTFLISEHPGDHKIRQDDIAMDNDLRTANASMKEIDIEFYTVDEVLDSMNIESLDHLSITVNGAEFNVLLGADRILKRSKKLRIYSKAHARDNNGVAISEKIIPHLQGLGFNTILTRGEASSTADKNWKQRNGDVYAWKST